MSETENLTLEILKKIQSDMVNINHKVDEGFSSMNLQFAALNEKLSGQMLSEMDLRSQLNALNDRLNRVERRLELSND